MSTMCKAASGQRFSVSGAGQPCHARHRTVLLQYSYNSNRIESPCYMKTPWLANFALHLQKAGLSALENPPIKTVLVAECCRLGSATPSSASHRQHMDPLALLAKSKGHQQGHHH